MANLQHRGGKHNKIVLKHHPIDGLVKSLSFIEALQEVQTIMPGVITSVRGRPVGSRQSGGIVLKLQYIAPDGHIRLIARHGNTTQEVRVVSSNPNTTYEKLKKVLD